MRKALLLLTVFGGLCMPTLIAEETADQKVVQTDEEPDVMKWKLINTGIFIAVLGFAVIKLAPKFFQARSQDIQKAIKDATGLKIEADFRYSEIDKRMANLAGEVARMKADAAAEMEREHERILHETEEEVEHIADSADFEIDSLRAEGALQVKRHTAQLAFATAERRLQRHFAQNDDQNNVGEFVAVVGGNR